MPHGPLERVVRRHFRHSLSIHVRRNRRRDCSDCRNDYHSRTDSAVKSLRAVRPDLTSARCGKYSVKVPRDERQDRHDQHSERHNSHVCVVPGGRARLKCLLTTELSGALAEREARGQQRRPLERVVSQLLHLHSPRPNLCAKTATTKNVTMNAAMMIQIGSVGMNEMMAQDGNSATNPAPSQKLAG